MKLVSALFILFAVVPLVYVWEGFVFIKFWTWFAMPTFALPVLSLPVAIGLFVMVRFAAHQTPQTEEKKEGLAVSIASAFVKPLAYLMTGAIAHSFM